jgi:hypothetical protein
MFFLYVIYKEGLWEGMYAGDTLIDWRWDDEVIKHKNLMQIKKNIFNELSFVG